MKPLILLGFVGFLFLGLSCYSNGPADPSSSDNWNSVRSDWTDSKSYGKETKEAKDAFDTFQSSATGNTANNIDHFQVILQSVVENADGTQTWTYAVSKLADGPNAQDLSHFTVLFDNCANANFVDLDGGTYGPDSSALDCTAGNDGVKWDKGVGANETVFYSFTTDQIYETGTITGLVKYSTTCATASIPGPDCSKVVTNDDGGSTDNGNNGDNGDGDGNKPPTNDCPTWIDTLTLTASVEYKNFHGYNNLGFPIYYIGETMHSNLTICNNTDDTATGLKVVTLVMEYPAKGLACGNPVQTWTGVTIAAHDCLTLDHAFLLDTKCPWGNYESHLVISREADGACPLATLIMNNGAVGFFDP